MMQHYKNWIFSIASLLCAVFFAFELYGALNGLAIITPHGVVAFLWILLALDYLSILLDKES